MECLLAAAENKIRPTEKTGELVDIALKAMATDPNDRYATVGEFQDAIREYQSHSQSICLPRAPKPNWRRRSSRGDYETYARSRFAFQEAYALWDGNTKAAEGIVKCSAAYARSALRKGDYDLGASLLNPKEPAHQAHSRRNRRRPARARRQAAASPHGQENRRAARDDRVRCDHGSVLLDSRRGRSRRAEDAEVTSGGRGAEEHRRSTAGRSRSARRRLPRLNGARRSGSKALLNSRRPRPRPLSKSLKTRRRRKSTGRTSRGSAWRRRRSTRTPSTWRSLCSTNVPCTCATGSGDG